MNQNNYKIKRAGQADIEAYASELLQQFLG